ncbi:phosphotransferase family protein [Nocardia sp. NPDC057440]|uniref:phosphotransferase family protein n=1 Tax=Nocardia sp. NPDC057440 TaxID=3346134 RepID=UPI003671E934
MFVKAISATRNSRAPGLYRREIEVMGSLPTSVPAPQLQWSYDDGDWVMLVLDDVDGRMLGTPWQREDLTAAIITLEQMATALTPAPITAMPITDDLAENFRSWAVIADSAELAARVTPWAHSHLDRLLDLETGWTEAARGDSLLHADLRGDNMLLTQDGRVVVVDWPYAVLGAPWVDGLLFLPSVPVDGGPSDLESLWRAYAPSRKADPDAVTAVLAAVAGDFTLQSLLPPPENIPTLRAHQAAKASAALSWLRARLS